MYTARLLSQCQPAPAHPCILDTSLSLILVLLMISKCPWDLSPFPMPSISPSAQVFIISCLDYCKSLFPVLPASGPSLLTTRLLPTIRSERSYTAVSRHHAAHPSNPSNPRFSTERSELSGVQALYDLTPIHQSIFTHTRAHTH